MRLIILILCFIFISCSSYIQVFTAKNKANDAFIWGDDLNSFFSNSDEDIEIHKEIIKINSTLVESIKENKLLLLDSKKVDVLSGRYKYVIIF